MAEWGTCWGCRYLDSSERDGEKCYCEWYRTYEYPGELQKCEHRDSN
jgi:hypothetical protein